MTFFPNQIHELSSSRGQTKRHDDASGKKVDTTKCNIEIKLENLLTKYQEN